MFKCLTAVMFTSKRSEVDMDAFRLFDALFKLFVILVVVAFCLAAGFINAQDIVNALLSLF